MQALIEEGAVELMVPGNFPVGCSAAYLTLFQTPNKAAYDKHGCLKSHNAFAKYHNAQLKLALELLRQKYPHAKIIYADYYGAAKRFVHSPKRYGKFFSFSFELPINVRNDYQLITCFLVPHCLL